MGGKKKQIGEQSELLRMQKYVVCVCVIVSVNEIGDQGDVQQVCECIVNV